MVDAHHAAAVAGLRGLCSFFIAGVDTSRVPQNIDVDSLHAVVGLEMRRSGITVVEKDSNDARVGRVYVSLFTQPVTSESVPTDAYAFTVRTAVRRWVRNATRDNALVPVTAWQRDFVGYAPNRVSLRLLATEAIGDGAQALANALRTTATAWPP